MPDQPPLVVLIDPIDTLAEALCRDLHRRGYQLVTIGNDPHHGAAFSQRLAAEQIAANWRFVDPALAGSISGVGDDLWLVYGRITAVVSFFKPLTVSFDYLQTPAPGLSKLVEQRYGARLALLQELAVLVTREGGRLLNLHIGLRDRPAHQRGVNGQVAEMLDVMLAGALAERGVVSSSLSIHRDAGLNLSVIEHLRDDLERVLIALNLSHMRRGDSTG